MVSDPTSHFLCNAIVHMLYNHQRPHKIQDNWKKKKKYSFESEENFVENCEDKCNGSKPIELFTDEKKEN